MSQYNNNNNNNSNKYLIYTTKIDQLNLDIKTASTNLCVVYKIFHISVSNKKCLTLKGKFWLQQ